MKKWQLIRVTTKWDPVLARLVAGLQMCKRLQMLHKQTPLARDQLLSSSSATNDARTILPPSYTATLKQQLRDLAIAPNLLESAVRKDTPKLAQQYQFFFLTLKRFENTLPCDFEFRRYREFMPH